MCSGRDRRTRVFIGGPEGRGGSNAAAHRRAHPHVRGAKPVPRSGRLRRGNYWRTRWDETTFAPQGPRLRVGGGLRQGGDGGEGETEATWQLFGCRGTCA